MDETEPPFNSRHFHCARCDGSLGLVVPDDTRVMLLGDNAVLLFHPDCFKKMEVNYIADGLGLNRDIEDELRREN